MRDGVGWWVGGGEGVSAVMCNYQETLRRSWMETEAEIGWFEVGARQIQKSHPGSALHCAVCMRGRDFDWRLSVSCRFKTKGHAQRIFQRTRTGMRIHSCSCLSHT